jgi:hypothetical protein
MPSTQSPPVAPQGHNDDESTVEKPPHRLPLAPSGLGVSIVWECAMRDDHGPRRHLARWTTDARLQQMLTAGSVDHRNPMDLFPPNALRAANGSCRRLNLRLTNQSRNQD